MHGLLLTLLLALTTAACQPLLGIDPPPAGESGPAGWLFYTTDSTGTIEAWAVPDAGGTPVRITDGMSDSSLHLDGLTASPDGQRLALASSRSADGQLLLERHLWVVDVDGSDPRHITPVATGTWFAGMSWQGDSRHLVYVGGAAHCDNELRRVDIGDPAEYTLIHAGTEVLAQPMPSRADPADLVVAERYGCSDDYTPRRLDLGEQTLATIDDVVDHHKRYKQLRRSADGSRIAYAFGNVLFIHDFTSEVAVYTDPEPGSTFDVPVFGNRDTRLYAKWCSATSECDLVAIEIITGAKTNLGVPDIRPDVQTSPSITWTQVDIAIDSDDDGLADGIDPSPLQ